MPGELSVELLGRWATMEKMQGRLEHQEAWRSVAALCGQSRWLLLPLV